MSQRITIQIIDKIATCLTELPIVCGNSDYECEFLFDEEWNEHNIKTARFKTCNGYNDVIFEGNVCPMPIISNAKIVWVGVFAGELSTSTPAIAHCRASILDGEDVPSPPREDVYEQILSMYEDVVETAEDIEKRANDGEFNGKSAYEIACENGFEGTEEDWLNQIPKRDEVVSKFAILDEEYLNDPDVNKESYENLMKNFQRVYVERSWKNGKPRGQYSKITTTAEGDVNKLPRNTSKAPDDPTNDILGSLPERQGDFLGDRRFAGHIFVRPELPFDGWVDTSGNSLERYAEQIATPKKYVDERDEIVKEEAVSEANIQTIKSLDNVNTDKSAVAPYANYIRIRKKYRKDKTGSNESTTIGFVNYDVPDDFQSFRTDLVLTYDYTDIQSGITSELHLVDKTTGKNKQIGWATFLGRRIMLNCDVNASNSAQTKAEVYTDELYYNLEKDKKVTITAIWENATDTSVGNGCIRYYINGKPIITQEWCQYEDTSNKVPMLAVSVSQNIECDVSIFNAGVNVSENLGIDAVYSHSFINFDKFHYNENIKDWSLGDEVGVRLSSTTKTQGYNTWKAFPTECDIYSMANKGYVDGKVKSLISEALSGIVTAEGGSY